MEAEIERAADVLLREKKTDIFQDNMTHFRTSVNGLLAVIAGSWGL